MKPQIIPMLEEAECQALESFLADRIYEFNSSATGYFDGKLIGGSILNDAGEVVAGFTGHTWSGCCEITHIWVEQDYRGHGYGRALLQNAESEALRRGCTQVTLTTHSFQAPEFYERLGYECKSEIVDRPKGHSDFIYVKLLSK
ncbi:MAG TPA: GNAT family N-acetyltransferase [Methylophilaceae bacterium]